MVCSEQPYIFDSLSSPVYRFDHFIPFDFARVCGCMRACGCGVCTLVVNCCVATMAVDYTSGGGLGGTRRGGPAMNTRHSGREDPDR